MNDTQALRAIARLAERVSGDLKPGWKFAWDQLRYYANQETDQIEASTRIPAQAGASLSAEQILPSKDRSATWRCKKCGAVTKQTGDAAGLLTIPRHCVTSKNEYTLGPDDFCDDELISQPTPAPVGDGGEKITDVCVHNRYRGQCVHCNEDGFRPAPSTPPSGAQVIIGPVCNCASVASYGGTHLTTCPLYTRQASSPAPVQEPREVCNACGQDGDVLADGMTLTPSGWFHRRCVEEMAAEVEPQEVSAEEAARLINREAPAQEGMKPCPLVEEEHVEWVVNDLAELGVKIGNRFFWLYKGRSLVYADAIHTDEGPNEGRPLMWRHVFKREFGECVHPINYKDPSKIGTVSLDVGDWRELPKWHNRRTPTPQQGGEVGELVASWDTTVEGASKGAADNEWAALLIEDGQAMASLLQQMQQRVGELEQRLVLFDAIRAESIERREKLEAAEAARDLAIKALEKLKSYNVDIRDGRINYRPEDHIAVCDAALTPSNGGQKDG